MKAWNVRCPTFSTNLNHAGHRVSQRQATDICDKNLVSGSRFGPLTDKNVHLTLCSEREPCLCFGMDKCRKILIFILLMHLNAFGASKPHVVSLGRWTSISIRPDEGEEPTTIKIRSLNVDGLIKEFTIGTAHELTERMFVVQRIYRVNDSLPQQTGPTQWQWQRGGWLLVDRRSGKIQQLALAEFDPDSSAANWFR